LNVSAGFIEEVAEDCTWDYFGALRTSAVDGLSNQLEAAVFTKLLFNVVSDRWRTVRAFVN
jgi:hypothetical protein